MPGIQLAHAGRKASLTQPWNGDLLLTPAEGGWQTVAPSALPFSADKSTPKALSVTDIQQTIAAFVAATHRAVAAGFKVMELHGAHGYLIHEFLSPLSNTRTDEYGGSYDNRIRFLLQIIEAVRAAWPQEYPLMLRISATDWTDGGWTIQDSERLAPIVQQLGVDLIDCSSGGNVLAPIPAGPGYQVPFAAAVRKTGVPTGAVGIIVTAQQAEDILAEGQADLVFMARELLRNPYFPLQAAAQLGHADHPWPVQYERAKRRK